ncbi:PREDICTED: protein FANTASTIC FOUR 3 isoform X1 [Tarenaya hassleriana]|uniref:protein FANTASTIC FOUR 3 isoform X1 n=1 Tax=Tarenaya hassleriana TaxID=28532 RepID=UPI00053C690F|nr:PREDICTED: protein FANTASTIC FOUR 3 isoform X1 [Tarenaya hassleriana]XP_010546858.1 PREDICTED: protein FANTASTIC FOUR 3 isoform X1 [Tarenaya hassleriana]XP_010546859.1 PREDICTED: protein FANTASTIC FOUR 3 isoform X1 [Tarenaya hassleriana]XP_010546861.1 PREDICTED: protein FANTASTIC FOUR 3 isoform X1 [Tarenaya hassleriana]XP_010546862.1 PREDICTED: protein FANTASTIC FOUR 3 isoform X1 [Tarenaya hassleriana]XP_010546863.1 PREDICTED: protein FANTASTIC FOUR 3 isoform X1 [Tarenaya hassleriana]XP_01
MATVVYQGFQSCLESHQLSEPRALRLRLSAPNPHFCQPLELAFKSCSLNSPCPDPDLGGWSFLQALSLGSPLSNPSSEKEKAYVQSSPSKTLSEKSLALCTENLGNETGSDITDDDVFSLTSPRAEETRTLTSRGLKSRKGNVVPSFPPPLTSMRGFECIRLRPHREDGRLVLRATNEPPRNTCFHAERSNGRLRLSILRDSDHFENQEEDEVEDEEERVEPENEIHTAECDLEREVAEEKHDDDEEKQTMSVENHLQRPGRCVEGDQDNRGLLNWDHFCVATS